MGAWKHDGSPYLAGSPMADRIESSRSAMKRERVALVDLPRVAPRTAAEVDDEQRFWSRAPVVRQ